MTELLIATVGWLATVGFIAAIVADTFRWQPGNRNGRYARAVYHVALLPCSTLPLLQRWR